MGDFSGNTQLHKEATEAVNRWFHAFWVPSDRYLLIEKHGMEYHFCGSEDVLKREFKKRNGKSLDHIVGMAGWGGTEGQNWTVAHIKKDGTVIANQWAFGHEQTHLIADHKLVDNPDEATKKGYYL